MAKVSPGRYVVRMTLRTKCMTVARRFLLPRNESLPFSLRLIKHFLLFHRRHRTLSPRELIKGQRSLGVTQLKHPQSTL